MNEKILLVDDDEEICDEIGGLLRDTGFQVTVAFDGETAVKLLGKKNFDLLILDLKVPGISGIEILRHVKAKRMPLKVLVVTGKPVRNLYDQDSGKKAGDPEQTELFDTADGFVGKPFDIDILLARIKTLI